MIILIKKFNEEFDNLEKEYNYKDNYFNKNYHYLKILQIQICNL